MLNASGAESLFPSVPLGVATVRGTRGSVVRIEGPFDASRLLRNVARNLARKVARNHVRKVAKSVVRN